MKKIKKYSTNTNYKDGHIYYGDHQQQKQLVDDRWNDLILSFKDRYPEIVLLQNNKLFRLEILDYLKVISFKHKHRLRLSLYLVGFKKIHNNEFAQLLNKFKNYLNTPISKIQLQQLLYKGNLQ